MSNRIIVEFSGWVECDPDKVMFRYIFEDDFAHTITGTEWLKLQEHQRDRFILEDCIEAQQTALDGSLEYLDTIIVDEEGREVSANRTYS